MRIWQANQAVLRTTLLGGFLLGLTLGMSSAALGQARDFGSFQGNSARQGHSADPLGASSGLSGIRWFTPSGVVNTTFTYALDNTDVSDAWVRVPPDPLAYPGGPYNRPLFGAVVVSPKFLPNKASYNDNAEWSKPAKGYEAKFPYQIPQRATQMTLSGNVYPRSSSFREPLYNYTRCTASAVGSDPTKAQNANNRRRFEWWFTGRRNVQVNWALYVWLPVGATRIGAGPDDLLFPQRYNVYEIEYRPGLRVIDVVDTYASGGGWVRLGGGGKPTNVVFPYDGINPIKVKLLNTMPRDANGKLTMEKAPENYCVYADAAKAVPVSGSYEATPVVSNNGGASTEVVAVRNGITSEVTSDGRLLTLTRAIVTNYIHNWPFENAISNTRWEYMPFADTTGEGFRDDVSSDVTVGPNWTQAFDTKFLNGAFRHADITNVAANRTLVTYAPTLNDDIYDIFVWLAGDTSSLSFGDSVEYEILEGTTVTKVRVNQKNRVGWFRLGQRRFRNVQSASGPKAPLVVRVSNYSPLVGDLGKKAMADGIRFVGTNNVEVKSTPVIARARVALQASGGTAERRVVIVADESGRIRCLDMQGRNDTTTFEYWIYPSRRRAGYVDPNLKDGIDGRSSPAPTSDSIPIAEMPSGFDLSSALVQRINGEDYLYIASKNGRIYCLEMKGRGDYSTGARAPGTTRRVWSYPDDFPAVPKRSNLGAFTGSLTFANTAAGPTIFAPTASGRIIALDALPSGVTQTSLRTTTVRWAYPDFDEQPLGAISSTPAIEFGNLYFGAQQKNDQYARFYSLNPNTGQPNWQFPSNADLGTTARFQTKSFLASPLTVSSALLGGGMPNTVFTLNQNGHLFALNAATGEILWSSNELATGSTAALTFTYMNVFDSSGTGAKTFAPVVLVPTQDGRFASLFARTADTNRFGTRRAWEYNVAGESVVASLTPGNNFLYGGDDAGFLYAFTDTSTIAPGLGDAPGEETLVENDTRGDLFREARVQPITPEAYQLLRQGLGEPGHPTYGGIIDPATRLVRPQYRVSRSPLAYEWGETMYLFCYEFPYVNTAQTGAATPVAPPVVNFSFSVEGQTTRTIPVESRQFDSPGASPITGSTLTPPQDYSPLRNDGYAILPFTFQGGGPNALPPGTAETSFTISTSALNVARALENVTLDPTRNRIGFTLANPLAISMDGVTSGLSIGLSVQPENAENLVNGSPDVGGSKKSWLLQSAGQTGHGKSATARMFVVDRSMMGLIRPDGLGLDNVRVERAGLAWQGGASTIYKPLSNLLYPGFEDRPTGIPNLSLDYPDIRPENIAVVKDPNGLPQNPVFSTVGVSLRAPLVNDGGTLRTMRETDSPTTRVFQPTVFDFQINVPRFQPPNNASVGFLGSKIPTSPGTSVADPRFIQPNSLGNTNLDQGYIGRMSVYVDSSSNGVLDTAFREAYRSFSLATAVGVDEKLSVNTPSVDPSSGQSLLNLGSLAGGTGYTLSPGDYSPWGGTYTSLFQPFTVLNEGNVNLLDVRLAKSLNSIQTPGILPWIFNSQTSDSNAWLDGSLDLWSNFDTRFAPVYALNVNRQIVQKPRVGDTIPTQLTVNPTRRDNSTLGVVGGSLIAAGPTSSPKVSVTVPLGFPSGTYSQTMRVIENDPNASNETWDRVAANSVESFSDPTFKLVFKVRETRLTNKPTAFTANQIENLIPNNARFAYKNTQPGAMRDPFGNLLVAWISNRPSDTPFPGVPAAPLESDPWRIYFASLDNGTTFTSTSVDTPGGAGYSPIRDLNFWNQAGGTSWFKFAQASSNGYPSPSTNFNLAFGITAGETLVPQSIKFYHPTFPVLGRMSPTDPGNVGAAFTQGLMAFTGEAKKQGDSGNNVISRIFLARLQTDQAGAVTVASAPIPLPFDDGTVKGRPSIVQTGSNSAVVFYPATSGNGTVIMAANYTEGVWSAPASLPLGTAFSSVTGVSATTVGPTPLTGSRVIDLVITGKLYGATQTEVFSVQVGTSPGLQLPISNGAFTTRPFVNVATAANETLRSLGGGTFAASGMLWDLNETVDLRFQRADGSFVAALKAGTRTQDPQTSVISYESTLGGRVFLNPFTGQVKFSSSVPGRNLAVVLTYAPRLIRVSEGDVSYGTPNVMFDGRKTSDGAYWTPASATDPTLRNDRWVYVYTKAGGSGEGPRPVVKTMRLGIQLPTSVQTDDNGVVSGLSVSGNVGPYQVDPANGRVYFTLADRYTAVSVSYLGVSAADGATLPIRTVSGTVLPIVELGETLVPIEQAVNETGTIAFMDPFEPQTTDLRLRRPPLVWFLWSSTRAGVPDIYIQSIAPRLTPVPLGK